MKKALALLSLSALMLTACGSEFVSYEHQKTAKDNTNVAWQEQASLDEYLEWGVLELEDGNYIFSSNTFMSSEFVRHNLYREKDGVLTQVAELDVTGSDIPGLTQDAYPTLHLVGHGTDKKNGDFFIVAAQNDERAPGICGESYAYEQDESFQFVRMYLDGNSAEFVNTEIPAEITEAATAKQADCLENI